VVLSALLQSTFSHVRRLKRIVSCHTEEEKAYKTKVERLDKEREKVVRARRWARPLRIHTWRLEFRHVIDI
jgi:hypothetical protein